MATFGTARAEDLERAGGLLWRHGELARAPRSAEERRASAETAEPDDRAEKFIFATETPIPVRGGVEVLRMAGANLRRFLKNPVVLDSHKYDESDRVVGNARDVAVESVAVEAGTIPALAGEVVFAETKRANELLRLVRGDFLRTVSVGYFPLRWVFLDAGETDGEGAAQVTGPGVVIAEWELLEVSLVPVPADQNALVCERLFGAEARARAKRATLSDLSTAEIAQAFKRS